MSVRCVRCVRSTDVGEGEKTEEEGRSGKEKGRRGGVVGTNELIDSIAKPLSRLTLSTQSVNGRRIMNRDLRFIVRTGESEDCGFGSVSQPRDRVGPSWTELDRVRSSSDRECWKAKSHTTENPSQSTEGLGGTRYLLDTSWIAGIPS